MYSSAEDIYRELVEESEDDWLFGLVAFAIMEEQRIEWAKHYQSNNGQCPTADECTTWYEQQPKSMLLKARADAEKALVDYSSNVVATLEERQWRDIQKSAILKTIRDQSKFWPNFRTNFLGSLAGGLVLALLLIVLAFILLNDASPIAIGKTLGQQAGD